MKNLLAYIPAVFSAITFIGLGVLIQKIMTTGLYDVMTGGHNAPGFTILEEYLLVGGLIALGIMFLKQTVEKASED